MLSDVGERVQSEKQFHDLAFSDQRRKWLSKFYRLLNKNRENFRDYLMNRNLISVKALEYGCGPGSYAFALAAKGANVTGIDISTTAIEKAKSKITDEYKGKVQFIEMNAEDLSLPSDQFDLVYGTGILHHLDMEKSTNEIIRILKPGGEAVFIEPMAHNPLLLLFRLFTPKMRTSDEHPLTFRDIQYYQKRFSHIDAEYYYLVSLLALPFWFLPWSDSIANALHRIDRGLFKVLPITRYLSWQVTLKLRK